MGRSLIHTSETIKYFESIGVDIHFKKENIHTLSKDITNKLIINILYSLAEFEGEMISSRSERGRNFAIQKGKRET